MRTIELPDDSVKAAYKLFSAMTEADLESAGLSPYEIDQFGNVFLAFKGESEDVIQDEYYGEDDGE